MMDMDTGIRTTYEFDIRNGQAKTDSVLSTTDTYDCTSRPWYLTGISDDNCPKDEKNHYSCSLAWSAPYVDLGNDIETPSKHVYPGERDGDD